LKRTGVGGSEERLANLLGALALEAAGRIEAATGEVTTLSHSAVAALVALDHFASDLPQTELQAVLGLSQPATTRALDRLAAEGLVERGRNRDGDARELRVAPTSSGRAVVRRIGAARLEAMAGLVDSLPAASRSLLTSTVEEVLAALTGGRRDARRICRLCEPDVCGHPGRCPVTLAANRAERGRRDRRRAS
jgi:DNA-binding MarR family transcriptional regulator